MVKAPTPTQYIDKLYTHSCSGMLCTDIHMLILRFAVQSYDAENDMYMYAYRVTNLSRREQADLLHPAEHLSMIVRCVCTAPMPP